jgi:deazaflavin-dependent oxidoreductase (nitroreductase family)
VTLFGKEHVDRYVETDGDEGYEWRGTTILLLSTTGRTSGRSYVHPLIYRAYPNTATGSEDYLIVASKGGSSVAPDWFLNLQAQPEVGVQIKGETFTAHARVATAQEKPAMWAHMLAVWPDYAEYQTKTDREIPIVVLERIG